MDSCSQEEPRTPSLSKPDSLVQGSKDHGGGRGEGLSLRGLCNRETGNYKEVVCAKLVTQAPLPARLL